MKTSAFQLAAAAVMSATTSADDRLSAYDALLVIAKALGLKREAKRIRRVIRSLRAAEAQQIKFTALLDGERNGDRQ